MASPYRMLALDADGTLLDSSGEVRPAVKAAVGRARKAGIEPVLCTGRRYRTARPVLEALELLDGQAVIQNGVLVVDAGSGVPRFANVLPSEVYREAASLLARVAPPLAYLLDGPPDFASEASHRLHEFARDYLADHGAHGRIVESMTNEPEGAVAMLSCMADRESLAELRPEVEALLGDRIRTHLLRNRMYRGYILEILSASAGKWNAVLELAGSRGIAASEIIAIGDDQNDHEMIAGAGVGIAMADAPEGVRADADWVAPSSDDDGVVAALERYVFGAG